MNYIDKVILFLGNYYSEIIFTAIVILIYAIFKSGGKKLIKRHASKNSIDYSRELYIRQLFNLVLSLLIISLIGAIWEISIKGLSIYFASLFTVVGVALFANWSILSNMTASVIIFFFLPYKVGSKIRVIDGDNSVQGFIKDIGLFHVSIKPEDGNEVSYPNNLFIQKPVQNLN